VLVLRDRGEIEAVTAANLAYGVYDVSMTPSARRWGDQRIVINTPELTFFAKHYALKEPHRDPDSRHSMPTSPACRLPCSVAARSIHCSTTRCSWPPGGRRPEPGPVGDLPGGPHEFLNLSDPIAAASDARERMVGFIDLMLTSDRPAP
jgi:hypothetical protein